MLLTSEEKKSVRVWLRIKSEVTWKDAMTHVRSNKKLRKMFAGTNRYSVQFDLNAYEFRAEMESLFRFCGFVDSGKRTGGSNLMKVFVDPAKQNPYWKLMRSLIKQ